MGRAYNIALKAGKLDGIQDFFINSNTVMEKVCPYPDTEGDFCETRKAWIGDEEIYLTLTAQHFFTGSWHDIPKDFGLFGK